MRISESGRILDMIYRSDYGSAIEKSINYSKDINHLYDILTALETRVEILEEKIKASNKETTAQQALEDIQKVLESYGFHKKYVPSAE